MNIRRFALVLLGIVPLRAVIAQQKEDLYSIPAKAKYNPAALAGKRPLTRPERTNYAETSLYTDVTTFLDSLKLLGAKIEIGSIGKSSEGRDLPYVIASRPLITTPAAARAAGRPVVYVQANIHSGEVEGKEAMLAMLRDLLFDKKPNVLDSIVLIVQPDYNADGNEKLGQESRLGSQNGPVKVGTRAQGQKWNLNRDYIGADAPETKASLAMFNKWNPDLFMDLHTTDGSVHGYSLTYSPTLTPASVTTIPYMTKTMLPEIRRRVRERQGFEMNDYGDFSRTRTGAAGGAPGGALGGGGFAGGGRAAGAGAAGRTDSAAGGRGGRGGGAGAGRGDSAAAGRGARGGGVGGAAAGAPRGGGGGGGASLETMIADSIPTSGWVFSTYEAFPRYGSNYYGLRGRLSILSEAFSHDPFQRRIASTYAFVGEILSYVAEHKKEIIELGKTADAQVAGWAKAPSTSPQIELQSRMDTTRIEDVRVEMLAPLTDPSKQEMGMRQGQQRTGIIKLVRMPVMASFAPTLTRTLPFAYVIDAKAADSLLPILKIHGVTVEKLSAAATVTAQAFMVDTIVVRPRNETPRTLPIARGSWSQPASRTLPVGTYIVPAGQQLGLLVFYLLEPESEDGLQSYLGGIMMQGKDFPVARITVPATLATRPAP